MSKKSSKAEAAPDLGYEQAIEKLESIVQGIETGEMPLEQSIEQYAEGMKLIQHCRSILNRAESRIKQLTENEDGELEIADQVAEGHGESNDGN